MSIQQDSDDKNKMIKLHQIEALTKASEFEGIKAGFLFCFYNEKINQESTYYMPIQNFNKFLKSTNKKSINIIDVVTYGCTKVDQVKLRTHYHYDIKSLFNKI
jgi:penicillin-binding protein-related factor A (putative recombinase)